MKRLLLLVLVMMTCVAGAESIGDGTAYDPGARRKNVPIVHNTDLSGVNDGDFKHLSLLELLEVQNLSTNYVASSSLVTVLLGYALLNGSSVVDFAADHMELNTLDVNGATSISGVVTIGNGNIGRIKLHGFNTISANTTDQADNTVLYLAGGGDAGGNRGAYIQLHGNEIPAQGGAIRMIAGNVGDGVIELCTADTLVLKLNRDRTARFYDDLTVDGDLTVGGGSDISILGDGAGNASINTGDLTVNADVNFTGTVTGIEPGIATHNNLLGLNSGDYQHLTAAELTELQGIDTNYVATSSLITVLLGYAALNGNIAEDFEADHIDAVTASFSGDVDVAGDLTVGSAVDMTMIGDGAGNVTVDTVATLTFAADTEFTGILDLSGANVIGLSAGIATHNNLLGLNAGDYQHLTALELAELQAMDTNYVATSTLTTTLADYALTNSLGSMATANTTDYVATSTYDADMGDISAALAAILGS